ncbi:MAG: DUF2490 domain-containing protein [Bacteroidota bacterium]
MNKKGKTYLLLFFILSFAANAQVKDAGLWLGLSAEKKLSTRFALELTEEVRFNENISELATALTELGIGYKITKGLTSTVSYRFSQRRRVDDFYSLRHRYNIDLSYKVKIKKISVTMRGRFQSQYTDINASETGNVPRNYLRSKFALKYLTGKKTSPFISIEFFNRINDPSGEAFVDNIRYQFGLDHELNKFSTITLSYLINKQVNVNNPWTSYITAIGYKFSF